MIAASVLLLLSGGPMLGIGLEVRDGDGDVEAEHFVYPNAGIALDSPRYYVEANSALPILVPDLLAAVVVFLSGGDSIPLWYSLNGKREPVAVRFLDAAGRVALPLADVAAIEAGAGGGLFIGSVFVGEERIGVHPLFAGPSLAFRTGTSDTIVVRVVLQGGNAWTHHASINPWFGASARSTMSLGKTMFFELRGDWSRTRVDLRSYRTVEGMQIAGIERLDTWGAEARVGIRL